MGSQIIYKPILITDFKSNFRCFKREKRH